MSHSRGKFISLEGSEGAGKSTAMSFIKELLAKQGADVVLSREPGGTAIADEIRKVLLHPGSEEKMFPTTELLLMFASRAQHIAQCIEPALSTGKWVLSDRYVDASYAYQGGGRGLPMNMIEQLDKMVVGSLYPDLTLLLDVPSDVGALRTERRPAEKDRIELEKIEFFMRVRNVYLERAKQFPDRIKVIDGSQTIAAVQSQIHEVLTPILSSWKT
jgi:dTMP kinase